MQKSDSIVIIPTYNERENIENIIRAVFALEYGFHILIIEDGSPDGTADIVKELQQEFPDRLFMVERQGKLGLGTAYIAGFKWALQRDYEYIFEMDADFSHNPQDLPRLHRACAEEGADVAIGSRYVRTRSDVLFRFQIRTDHNRTAYPRYDCRLCLLPSQGAANNQLRQYPLQGLCFSD